MSLIPGTGLCTSASVSSSGAVVVGGCLDFFPSFTWLFRWTSTAGSDDPAMPANSVFLSAPPILSGDGATFVAASYPCSPGSPPGALCDDLLVWRASDPVLRSLRTELASGAIPPAWTKFTPVGISDDGRRIVATATDGTGAPLSFHVTLDPPPPLDSDGDGVLDDGDGSGTVGDAPCSTGATTGCDDNCRYTANPSQVDHGGIGAGSLPDGIGDPCQCGDVNGDGWVSLADATIITRSLIAPPTATLANPSLCDVGGPPGCSSSDVVILRRAILNPPTASVQQRCAPATPKTQSCYNDIREGAEVCDFRDGCPSPFSCIYHCTLCTLNVNP
jgi:hypothetical protein